MSLALGCASEQGRSGSSIDQSTTAPTGTTTTGRAGPSTTSALTAGIAGGCPSGIGAAAQSPEQAAECLYQAWAQGDRVSAAVFAQLDVVPLVFQTSWTPPQGTFLGCVAQSDGGQQCSIQHHGAPVRFEVRRSEGGWRVTQYSQG